MKKTLFSFLLAILTIASPSISPAAAGVGAVFDSWPASLFVKTNLDQSTNAADARARLEIDSSGGGAASVNGGTFSNVTFSTSTFSGSGSGLTNVPGTSGLAFVALGGSDAAAGTIAAPFATVEAAVNRYPNATIYVRGGDRFGEFNNISNAQNITIIGYPNERANFYGGEVILPGAFAALTNGIFTTTMSATFVSAVTVLTNQWDVYSPQGRGIYLFQTNVAFGPHQAGFYAPPMLTSAEETNRCIHTPMRRAVSVSAMTNQNAVWFAQGTTLFIKFAVSNAPGGIYIPSTNFVGQSFVYGANTNTQLHVENINTYFMANAFDFTGCSRWSFKSCLAFGTAWAGFSGNNDLTSGKPTGGGEITGCEGAANIGQPFIFFSTINQRMVNITEVGCYWHDYLREADVAAEGVNRTVIASVAFGGYGQFGFIDQGSSSTYIGCRSYSNSVAGWQLGSADGPLGRRSYQRLVGCRMIEDISCLQINDKNNIVEFENCIFSSAGSVAVNIADASAHYLRYVSCVNTKGNQVTLPFTGGSISGSTIVMDTMDSGTGYRVDGTHQLTGSDAAGGWSIYLNNNFTVSAAGHFKSMGYTNNATSRIPTNTAPFKILTNNFTLDTYYTNSNQRGWVSQCFGLSAGGAANARVALYLDQDQNGTFEQTGNEIAVSVGQGMSNSVSAFIQPLGRFIFTNLSAVGGAAFPDGNSGQWVNF